MGQLEKYGLYVLCLVIFLILGVTIWGNPDATSPQQKTEVVPMRVTAGGTPLGHAELGDGNLVPASNRSGANMLNSLLQPVKKPRPKTVLPAPVAGNDPATGRPATGRPATGRPATGRPATGRPAADGPTTGQPGGSKPVAKPVTPVATTRKYTVKKGDILGRIAQKQLGSTRYVQAIRDLNKGLTDKLTIGQVLILPASVKSGGSTAKAKATGAYRTYTISSGDTFERIARVELKSRSRFQEIQDLNPNVSPTRLIPGRKIKLPLE